MARYVVLYFENNVEAEALVELTHKETIVALVPAPTQFCEGCTGKNKGWTLGQKYGWWVCIFCKKPSRRWGQSYRAVVGAGKNLLEEEAVRPPPGFDQDSLLGTA
jgi:hypothetical protein